MDAIIRKRISPTIGNNINNFSIKQIFNKIKRCKKRIRINILILTIVELTTIMNEKRTTVPQLPAARIQWMRYDTAIEISSSSARTTHNNFIENSHCILHDISNTQ